ncbi:hypothetical protein RIF29_37946 [Crotalaria pallida]|uniref:Pentatricopeptide repeat protein n=1 Tax=Crotalaria pallida TaxID=3830 RepID=A0AAN9E1B5_CROPI
MMTLCSTLSLVHPTCVTLHKLTSTSTSTASFSSTTLPNLHGIFTKSNTSTRFLLNAGFNEYEPDLNEDYVDPFRTNGIDIEDFKFGVYDDHHTYFEGEQVKRPFWDTFVEELTAGGPPTGFQGLISLLFPPAIAAGVYFNVPGEYLYIGTAIFTIIFCIIEMDKPDQPHNFEPQIYNMERGSRDKMINDYNTMDIWDFNEKYGDLWDFTIKKDDITKRYEKALLQGQQLHALLVKACAVDCSVFLGTKLVHMHGKCGSFLDAYKVFDRMPDRTIFTLNAMIGACVSNGNYVGALELYKEMRVLGVSLDAYTFPLVLKACGVLNEHRLGEETHGVAFKFGYCAAVFVCNALIAMYARCCDLDGDKNVGNRVSDLTI